MNGSGGLTRSDASPDRTSSCIGGTGTIASTSVALAQVDPGLDAASVLTMKMSLQHPRFFEADAVERLVRLMAYAVEQRTQEIGIRLALGTDAAGVRRMILVQGMRLALAGVVVGLMSAFGLARLIANLLYGVTARDPFIFVTVPIVLTLVTLVGVWLPARRAIGVGPVVALRAE